jgi:hypothetical protein
MKHAPPQTGRKVGSSHRWRDEAVTVRLWTASEDLTGVHDLA